MTDWATYSQGGRSPAPGMAMNEASGGVEFDRLLAQVGQKVQKIQSNTRQLEGWRDQIGTPRDSDKLREQVHSITHFTQQLIRETSQLVQSLDSAGAATGVELDRHRRLQRNRVVDEMTRACNTFQQVQRDLVNKERESIRRSRAASSGRPLIELDGANASFGGAPQQEQVMTPMEAQSDLQQVEERERQLRQLEQDIVNVNDIFTQLGALVHEQGEMLDSIENNVESAQVQVAEGDRQLQQAVKHKRSARKKKIICVVIVLVVLAIIALILGVSLGGSS